MQTGSVNPLESFRALLEIFRVLKLSELESFSVLIHSKQLVGIPIFNCPNISFGTHHSCFARSG